MARIPYRHPIVNTSGQFNTATQVPRLGEACFLKGATGNIKEFRAGDGVNTYYNLQVLGPGSTGGGGSGSITGPEQSIGFKSGSSILGTGSLSYYPTKKTLVGGNFGVKVATGANVTATSYAPRINVGGVVVINVSGQKCKFTTPTGTVTVANGFRVPYMIEVRNLSTSAFAYVEFATGSYTYRGSHPKQHIAPLGEEHDRAYFTIWTDTGGSTWEMVGVPAVGADLQAYISGDLPASSVVAAFRTQGPLRIPSPGDQGTCFVVQQAPSAAVVCTLTWAANAAATQNTIGTNTLATSGTGNWSFSSPFVDVPHGSVIRFTTPANVAGAKGLIFHVGAISLGQNWPGLV